MVLRVSTTKIVSRPIEPVEIISPEVTFIAIDTYIETSRRDEFIIGNLFDYNGNQISYNWDSAKQQVASIKGKNLNTEVILLANEFLKNLYKRPAPALNSKELSDHIINSLKEFATPKNEVILSHKDANVSTREYMAATKEMEETNQDFIYDYENDANEPVFSGEFLSDDEEPDDFDEQLAIKSQEFLKEHPELKTEMEIVRLLEGN